MSEQLDISTPVGVLGAGTMGRGIAQVAATYGHPVVLQDSHPAALEAARDHLSNIMQRLVTKGRVDPDEAGAIQRRIQYVGGLDALSGCGLVVEAIVEELSVKQAVFKGLELQVSRDAVLATNTSSLSVTAVAAACAHPERVLGVHFFNPAPVMRLVEIVPGLDTDDGVVQRTRALVDAWGKTTALARDTPGFIVNRVARPFYGEALRILDEGLADAPTIDWAMREIGGFRMGPFELMDLIGNDINYTVTQTVFAAFFYDPRYRPSITQQRMVQAGRLGRKTGRGYYDYSPAAAPPQPDENWDLGEAVFERILVMLINEAADAVFWGIASVEDIDRAMTRGVNYPKGLLAWADDLGLSNVLARLEALQYEYGEDRYRPSPILRRMIHNGTTFYG